MAYAFFDDKIVLKAAEALPARALKRLGVTCTLDPFLRSIYSCSTSDSDTLNALRFVHFMPCPKFNGRNQLFETLRVV